jgi:hypothetical protein
LRLIILSSDPLRESLRLIILSSDPLRESFVGGYTM